MPSGIYIRTQKMRDNIGKATKGRKYPSRKSPTFTKEHIEKLGLRNTKTRFKKGHKHSMEVRKKISLANSSKPRPWKSGSNCPFWKGGITPINRMIRSSLEYKLWRKAVFERDDWTCVWCKVKGGTLNADHIKPFAYYPELRFAIDNGRTLCLECHKKTDTFAGRGIKTNNKKNI